MSGPDEIGLEELSRRLDEVTVVDVRHAHEYDGSFGSACDPRQGHIPGAINLDNDDLLLMSEEELAEVLGPPGEREIVAYCHSGSRSARAVRMLRELGYTARNYTGSWHEWSRTDQPIET